MIYMEERHLKIVEEILKNYPYEFHAFGSRVTGNPRKFSDLDLCYKETIPTKDLVKIEEDFEESNLPFKVELVSWKRCSEDFRERIQKHFVKIISQ